uniref:Uncharacterized protein n=1 Tax=Romanomermis culicivorax TaxID=13658 RepID=A0A915JBP9_ROMCU
MFGLYMCSMMLASSDSQALVEEHIKGIVYEKQIRDIDDLNEWILWAWDQLDQCKIYSVVDQFEK